MKLKACESNVRNTIQNYVVTKHINYPILLQLGNENYNWYELQEITEYKNGFSADHHTIKLFWEVFHDLSHEQKKKFLLFLTGSDRIPILGMKAVKVKLFIHFNFSIIKESELLYLMSFLFFVQIIIQRTSGGDSYLPVAHTCFNLLHLPVYNTKEKLRYKLLQAIQQPQGFALV